jgi:hypothetical protein
MICYLKDWERQKNEIYKSICIVGITLAMFCPVDTPIINILQLLLTFVRFNFEFDSFIVDFYRVACRSVFG